MSEFNCGHNMGGHACILPKGHQGRHKCSAHCAQGHAKAKPEEYETQTLTLSVTVLATNAVAMRKHLERMATQDVRVSPVEFARRHGFPIHATVQTQNPAVESDRQ